MVKPGRANPISAGDDLTAAAKGDALAHGEHTRGSR